MKIDFDNFGTSITDGICSVVCESISCINDCRTQNIVSKIEWLWKELHRLQIHTNDDGIRWSSIIDSTEVCFVICGIDERLRDVVHPGREYNLAQDCVLWQLHLPECGSVWRLRRDARLAGGNSKNVSPFLRRIDQYGNNLIPSVGILCVHIGLKIYFCISVVIEAIATLWSSRYLTEE